MHVIIVGAGIAGLACAWRLQQRGHTVEVFEREVAPGGRMRSEQRGDFVVDRGAQFIASAYRNLHALAAEVGIASQVRPLGQTHNAILRAGRLHPGDYNSVAAFVQSDLLSWRAKLRLPHALLAVWRHRRQLDPRRPELAAAIDERDMPTYLRRVVGEEAFEYLFAPAFSSTFDSDPEHLSGAFALITLRFLQSGFRLQSFEGGTGVLTRTLAERVPVRTAYEVHGVETSHQRAVVRVRSNGATNEHAADGVVLAVPGSLAPRLCASLTDDEQAFFRHVHYVRGIIVFLMLPQPPATLPYYGVAFPRREGLDLYGLAVDHHKPGVAPPGTGLLNAALTESAAARVWDRPDAEIVELVLDNLARTPIGRLEPIDAVVHRWDPMLPQFRAGYLRHLQRFLLGARSPRLAFAGDYLVGPYTEAALTSGLRAAGAIERQ
jgi:oxygen-dependent protoporphyrinogen oxidase